ncbi:MAG TPA: hypothetical protein VLH77_05210, partial [Gammaproteobacteria bacterium]|nr:hypothetical protein [Gammaproteobacteria bacterium]
LIQHIAKKYPSALSEKSKKLEKLTAHEYNEAQWTTIVTIHNIFASRHEGDNVNSLVINIQSAAVTCSDTLNQYYKGIIDKLEQENRTLKAESTDIVRPLLMHPASTALAATSSTSTITLSSISINIAPSAPSLSEMGNKKAEPANATAASSTTAAHPLSQHK